MQVNSERPLNFNKIYKENKSKVYRYILNKIRNKEITEELTQDVFIKISKNLNNFDESKSALTTWIYNITKNVLIDHFRKLKLVTVSIESSDQNYDSSNGINTINEHISIEDLNPNPLQKLISNESRNNLKKTLMCLPKSERKLITMYAIKSLSYEEIASELGIPMGTVKGTIHRARLNLKNRFALA